MPMRPGFNECRKNNLNVKKITFTMYHSLGFFKGSVKTPYYSTQHIKDTKELKLARRRFRSQDYLKENLKWRIEGFPPSNL